MSSDPNTTSSGTSQNDQVNTQGVVPTVLSYVGLGGSSSSNPSEAEPAFGAAVRPSNSAIGSDHEEHAREVAARAVGGTTSGSGSGFGSGVGSGAGAAGSDSLDSRGGSLAGSGVGGRDGTTTGSSIAGASATEAGLEGTSGGIGERKESRAAFGASEGANADESKTSAEPRHTEGQGSSQNQSGGNTGGPTGKLENKDAIPVAGGVKLGEKHWGESGIVPDNPKPAEEKNISSSEGQPDQSTRDNTSANMGGASGPAGSGSGSGSGSSEAAHKEGLMDKVKGKLHGSH